MVSILLVDDEKEWLASFKRTLIRYSVTSSENIFTADSSVSALKILASEDIDIVFLDLMLENESGEDILKKIKADYPALTIIIMTGMNKVGSAVTCIKFGASDYFVKTMSVDELIAGVNRIVKIVELEKDNKALRDSILASYQPSEVFSEFITCSPKMFDIFKYLTAVAGSSQSVLITGESGVGKGVIAKVFAKVSRPDKSFVFLNVAGLDIQMFSDTLFGHVKGAFTGADSKRIGLIPQAGDGVVFLDEIGELPLQSQLKLLYITQDGEYYPLGCDQPMKTSARFIFATNQDLEKRQAEGLFRKDLFYRLNTHKVQIPPLRERPEDIPLLFDHFLRAAAKEYNVDVPKTQSDVLSVLSEYSFPGNIRELRSIVYDVVAKHSGMTLCASFFEDYFPKDSPIETERNSESMPLSEKLPTVDQVVDELIEKAMKLSGNNQTKAASLIGLSQSTLSRRLKG